MRYIIIIILLLLLLLYCVICTLYKVNIDLFCIYSSKDFDKWYVESNNHIYGLVLSVPIL